MITKKEYLRAIKIVDEYEKQLKLNERYISQFKKGQRVKTTKGCRFTKHGFEGTVIGLGMWGEYPAVKVKKDTGRVVMCLAKNLIKI